MRTGGDSRDGPQMSNRIVGWAELGMGIFFYMIRTNFGQCGTQATYALASSLLTSILSSPFFFFKASCIKFYFNGVCITILLTYDCYIFNMNLLSFFNFILLSFMIYNKLDLEKISNQLLIPS